MSTHQEQGTPMSSQIVWLENSLSESKAREDDLKQGLENCRLLASRHRKEDWALLILGFCAEVGVVGSITR